jgi:hypothetical protein
MTLAAVSDVYDIISALADEMAGIAVYINTAGSEILGTTNEIYLVRKYFCAMHIVCIFVGFIHRSTSRNVCKYFRQVLERLSGRWHRGAQRDIG